MQSSQREWDVVIFAARENLQDLASTIQSAQSAAENANGGATNIIVLVNGNPGLAESLVSALGSQHKHNTQTPVAVWSIPFGDKANAWNQYVQRIWAGASLAFFLDGYVKLNRDAVQKLGTALVNDAQALGGSGLPNLSAAALAAVNPPRPPMGFHGNFCCIKGPVIHRLRERRIQLPLGLYRVDALMGALLAIDLDANKDWNEARILVHPQVSWRTVPKRFWRLNDIKSQLKRFLRQQRGVAENLAVKSHLRDLPQPPEKLAPTAYQLIKNWARTNPSSFQRFRQHAPLAYWTTTQLQDIDTQHTASIEPIKLTALTEHRK